MTPILYEKDETQFLTNGIGALADAITCTVTEERNGVFELEMSYPVDGALYAEIAEHEGRIILAKPNETQREQPFDIYSISTPMGGIVMVRAAHVSYRLNSIPVFPFTASNCPEAVTGLISHSIIPNPFQFLTDKVTSGNFRVSVPTNFRKLMHGAEGSLLDIYGGGDYLYDRWEVRLLARRGQDSGASIEYGKTLTDINQEKSIANMITGIAPYWTDNEGTLVTLPEKIIAVQTDLAYERIEPMDFSQDFEEPPTQDQLRAAATAYITASDMTKPRVSLKVSFVPLWQTESYKENPLYKAIAELERVSMGDDVRVRFVKRGIDVKARVTKTVYNVLIDRYDLVSIGDPISTTASRAVNNQRILEQAASKSFVADYIATITDAITGATGGHVIFRPKMNPQEILIMDTDDVTTAMQVMRINLAGIAFSLKGINGPYESGWLLDGTFVSKKIGAIKIDATIAKIINLNAKSIVAGVLKSKDGGLEFNLDNSTLLATGICSSGNTQKLMFNPRRIELQINDIPRAKISTYLQTSADGFSKYMGTVKANKVEVAVDDVDGPTVGQIYTTPEDGSVLQVNKVRALLPDIGYDAILKLNWKYVTDIGYVLVGNIT